MSIFIIFHTAFHLKYLLKLGLTKIILFETLMAVFDKRVKMRDNQVRFSCCPLKFTEQICDPHDDDKVARGKAPTTNSFTQQIIFRGGFRIGGLGARSQDFWYQDIFRLNLGTSRCPVVCVLKLNSDR